MFLIIKDNKKINAYNLNSNSHIEYKDLEIYYKNNNYYIVTHNDSYLSNNTKIEELRIGEYTVKNKNIFYDIKIFVYKNNEGYCEYKLYKKDNFVVSSLDNSNIINNDPYMRNYYLSCIDGYLKSNYDFSVNNIQYSDEILRDGDMVVFNGFKFIYYEDFLYINSFNVDIKLQEYRPFKSNIKYQLIASIPKFYTKSVVDDLLIEELEPFEDIKVINRYDFIKTIIPNIIMVISTASMAALGFYAQLLNNNLNLSSYTYLIMPVSILFTSIFLPLVFNRIEINNNKRQIKDNINKYLNYLKDYEQRLNDNINKYINSYNDSFFDLNNFEEKIFYANTKSKDYLTLSIGKTIKYYDFVYKDCDIESIHEHLKKIKNRINNITNYPLFLDLKEKKKVTIVSKINQKGYLFNLVLLELAYKHHYDDLYIAVYSKDLSIINDIYNLPHLFLSQRRLTFISSKELIELNQTKFDKPVIVLMYDYTDYLFTNQNIKTIYFSIDEGQLLKDSDAIVVYNNNDGYLYDGSKTNFSYYENHIDFSKYFRYLGKLKNTNSLEYQYRFKDVIKDTSIIENYKNNDYELKAYFSYSNNELLCLNLHESKQGPHGLVGGSTGSGKSELLISLLLSLCIRYSPDYLNIVLVDYKGGGIKESLSYKGECMPHIIASLTNLENNSLNRMIIALNNECLRRQELFKKLSIKKNIPIMNIDDYLSNSDKKLAHLLIVVDEFAELKKQQPEVIKDLISLSRIGRSLGLHLILATQKPAGVIDEEIWSNSRFKIALKVFEEKDSQDIIRCKDAAYLNKVGSFYLNVDSGISKAQCIYSKYDIEDKDTYRISLLNNSLQKEKSIKKDAHKTIEEVCYLTKQVIEVTKKLNIKTNKLEFMPNTPMSRHELVKGNCLALGEIDDYFNNNKKLLAYELKDNLLIYSTRKHEINSILNTLNEYKRQSIVIAKNIYKQAYISDSLTYDDEEDILFILNYLLNKKINDVTLVVEDLSCLLSYNDAYSELIYKLVRRTNSNINMIFITTNTQIGFKLINAFKHKIMINVNDQNDLSAFFSTRSRYVGSSYCYIDEPICFVPIMCEKFKSSEPLLHNLLLKIPEEILPEIQNDKYLLGYDLIEKEKVFSSSVLITSFDETYLNVYAKAYPKLHICKYEHSLCKKQYEEILWLGSGVYSQRLIGGTIIRDLERDECLYVYKNEKHILKGLTHA